MAHGGAAAHNCLSSSKIESNKQNGVATTLPYQHTILLLNAQLSNSIMHTNAKKASDYIQLRPRSFGSFTGEDFYSI